MNPMTPAATITSHGRPSSYNHGGCRCAECTEAYRVHQGAMNASRRERLAADPSLAPHGRESTYTNWGCRCDECKVAGSEMNRRNSQRRAARGAA